MRKIDQEAERQMLNLVKNALLVAGLEMGENGDQWPVVKMTLRDVISDYENLQIQRAVDAEMKTHLYEELMKMEQTLLVCSAEDRTIMEPKLRELRDIYDAYFTEPDDDELILVDADLPPHVAQARAILETLEEEEETQS